MADSAFSLESLPTDLLAHIFQRLLPHIEPPFFWYQDKGTKYASFQRLRVVSRKFSQTFRQHPGLHRSLLVCGPLPVQHLSNLLHWTHEHAGSIEVVVFSIESSDCQDAVLAALVAARTQLLSLCLRAQSLSGNVLSLLPSFSSLTKCGFGSANGDMLDLMPLQALPSLTNLCLQGAGLFTGLHLLPYLTSLMLDDTTVGRVEDPSYRCLSTLRDLALCSSALYGLNSRGLLACKALESLCCDNCTVGARDETQALLFQSSLEAKYFPAAMTALTRLTHLELDIWFYDRGHFDLNWLSCLQGLEELSMDNDRSCLIGADVSRLSRLTTLNLGMSYACTDSESGHWGFATNWLSLPLLKTLKISQSVIEAGGSMLGLVQLVHLTQIDFMGCRPADAASQAILAYLLDAVSTRRPGIALAVDMRLMQRFD